MWTQSKISGKQGLTYRADLMDVFGYIRQRLPFCMVTGFQAGPTKVVCGHIVPCKSELKKLNHLGLSGDDLNAPRNCVFWALGTRISWCHLFDRNLCRISTL